MENNLERNCKYCKVKNILAKGKIAHFKQFLLLPECFQKMSATVTSASGKGLKTPKIFHNRLRY